MDADSRSQTNILLSARERLGLSQQQVAVKSHISVRQYQRYESGETNFLMSYFKIALRICKTLSLDPSIFLDCLKPDVKCIHKCEDCSVRDTCVNRGDARLATRYFKV